MPLRSGDPGGVPPRRSEERPSLRVVHVSFSSTGGAGRGAFALHRSLLEAGVDSHFVCIYKASGGPAIHAPTGIFGRATTRSLIFSDRWIVRASGSRATDDFSANPVGSRFIGRRIRNLGADIVNLHWVGNGTLSPRQITALGKPLVWTVRDMWPFTGGCHYSAGCEAFKESCGSCPVLGSSRTRDLSSWGQRRKDRAWRRADFHVVSISRWIAQQIAGSRILGEVPQRIIYPGIDTQSFRPFQRRAARERFGLSSDRKLVGFVAHEPYRERRKGWHVLLDALPHIKGATGVDVIVAGGEPNEDQGHTAGSGTRVISLGPLRDDETLAQLYSAVDVLAAPSLEESFGKVGAESLACGTPIVVFRRTGLEEIVSDGETGYAVEMGDAVSLGNSISKVLERGPESFAAPCRERAKSLFGLDSQADQYIDLYEEMMCNRVGPSTRAR